MKSDNGREILAFWTDQPVAREGQRDVKPKIRYVKYRMTMPLDASDD